MNKTSILDEAGRLAALFAALERLTLNASWLNYKTHNGTCALTMHVPGRVGTVTLEIGAEFTRVTAVSTADHGGTSLLEDNLSVDLSQGYSWNDAIFSNANELAYYLHKHMLRRERSVSDLEPDNSDRSDGAPG